MKHSRPRAECEYSAWCSNPSVESHVATSPPGIIPDSQSPLVSARRTPLRPTQLQRPSRGRDRDPPVHSIQNQNDYLILLSHREWLPYPIHVAYVWDSVCLTLSGPRGRPVAQLRSPVIDRDRRHCPATLSVS